MHMILPSQRVAHLVSARVNLLTAAVVVGCALRDFGAPRAHLFSNQIAERVAIVLLVTAWVLRTACACTVPTSLWGRQAAGGVVILMSVLALVPAGLLGVQCHCCSAMTISPGPIAGIVAVAVVLGLVIHAAIGLVFDDRRGRAVVATMSLATLAVFVPMFEKHIHEGCVSKTWQDLDALRNAVTLHDSQNRPLIGTSFEPLYDRYVREIPPDPWGRPYLLDARVGAIVSFGEDGLPGGAEEQADIVVRYKADLRLAAAQYTGHAPRVHAGDLLRLRFFKPFLIRGDPCADVWLLFDARSGGHGLALAAGAATDGLSWGRTTWELDQAGTDADAGVLVLRCVAGDPACVVRITSGCAIDLGPPGCPGEDGASAAQTIFESPAPGGPLDPAAHGPGVLLARPAVGVPCAGGERRGVPIACPMMVHSGGGR